MLHRPWSGHQAVALGAALACTLALALPAAAATGGPTVIAAFRDGPVNIHGGGTFGNVASLSLPAGRWLITAKGAVTSPSAPGRFATCRLEAGSDHDDVKAQHGQLSLAGGSTPLTLIVAHRFTSAGKARLRCKSTGSTGDDKISAIKLSAMKVGKLTRRAIGGATSTGGSGSPVVVFAFRNGDQAVPGDSAYHSLGSIPVPAGSWAFIGKAQLFHGSAGSAVIDCKLDTSADLDETVNSAVGTSDRAPIGLAIEHHFAAAGSATLACRSGALFHVSLIKLAAIKAGTLVRTPIGAPGTTSGSANPRIDFAFADGPLAVVKNSTASVGSVAIPAGNWSVRAKLFVVGTPFAPIDEFNVKCQLTLGSDVDAEMVELVPSVGMPAFGLSLQAVHHFSADGTASVDCGFKGGPGTVAAHDLRFIAVRAGSLTNTAL